MPGDVGPVGISVGIGPRSTSLAKTRTRLVRTIASPGEGPQVRDYYIGGTQVAFEALESMRRQLASELGRHGVRVVTLRTGGVPESIPKSVPGRERIVEGIEKETMLGRAATLEDVGNVAAFVASERARTMTAATTNISCGPLVDQAEKPSSRSMLVGGA